MRNRNVKRQMETKLSEDTPTKPLKMNLKQHPDNNWELTEKQAAIDTFFSPISPVKTQVEEKIKPNNDKVSTPNPISSFFFQTKIFRILIL